MQGVYLDLLRRIHEVRDCKVVTKKQDKKKVNAVVSYPINTSTSADGQSTNVLYIQWPWFLVTPSICLCLHEANKGRNGYGSQTVHNSIEGLDTALYHCAWWLPATTTAIWETKVMETKGGIKQSALQAFLWWEGNYHHQPKMIEILLSIKSN